MNLGIGPSNVGPEKELKIGTRIPIEADQGKFQYLDVGTTVQAQLREFKGSTSLEARVEITNFATPDQATKGGQPLLRQMIISGSTLVISDRPVIMGSVDDPNSKRQFQLEVTVTRLRSSESLLRVQLAKRVFEAQIEKDRSLTRAGPDSQWHTDSGNDLQAILEVIGPADTGAKEERVRPVRTVAGHDGL